LGTQRRGRHCSHGEKVGFEKGIIQGEQIGLEKGVRLTAQKFKNKGLSVEMISEVTGLSIEEIEDL